MVRITRYCLIDFRNPLIEKIIQKYIVWVYIIYKCQTLYRIYCDVKEAALNRKEWLQLHSEFYHFSIVFILGEKKNVKKRERFPITWNRHHSKINVHMWSKHFFQMFTNCWYNSSSVCVLTESQVFLVMIFPKETRGHNVVTKELFFHSACNPERGLLKETNNKKRDSQTEGIIRDTAPLQRGEKHPWGNYIGKYSQGLSL